MIKHYKGYCSMIDFDGSVYYGRVTKVHEPMTDYVFWQSDTLEDCQKEFEKAVDDYIQFCEEITNDD